MYIYIYIYTHTHTHIYVYINIYIYRSSPGSSLLRPVSRNLLPPPPPPPPERDTPSPLPPLRFPPASPFPCFLRPLAAGDGGESHALGGCHPQSHALGGQHSQLPCTLASLCQKRRRIRRKRPVKERSLARNTSSYCGLLPLPLKRDLEYVKRAMWK